MYNNWKIAENNDYKCAEVDGVGNQQVITHIKYNKLPQPQAVVVLEKAAE